VGKERGGLKEEETEVGWGTQGGGEWERGRGREGGGKRRMRRVWESGGRGVEGGGGGKGWREYGYAPSL